MEPLTTLENVFTHLMDQLRGGTGEDWDQKCLYAPPEVCAKSRCALSDPCLLLKATTVDDELVEHLPPEAEAAGLSLYCYGHTLFDVAESALQQRPKLTTEELLRALNYYNIHDSFLPFQEEKRRPKQWNIGLFPSFSAERLRQETEERYPDFLSRGRLLFCPCGSALIEGGDSELISMCNLISFASEWALFVGVTLPSPSREGRWSHHLYHAGYPSGPRAHPEDSKKQNQHRLVADLEGFTRAFPGTEAALLENYLRSDALIRDAYDRWVQFMTRRHRQKNWQPPESPPPSHVRPTDQYSSHDWRQVTDFLQYLGFPLGDALNI